MVKTPRNVQVNYWYTTVNAIQNYVNDSQCIDFYYYITDASNNAYIDVGWSVGLAPNPIEEVRAQSENKWQNYRFTYETPPRSSYFREAYLFIETFVKNFD